MHKICFVCTGNICRSPFAAGFFNQQAKLLKLNYSANSVGTRCQDGLATTADIISLAYEFEVDLRDHRSQPLQIDVVKDCRFIIGMEQSHCDAVIRLDPSLAAKTYLLRNFALVGDKRREIVDPYGLNPNFIRACYDDIAEAITGLLKKLQELDPV